MDIKKCDRCDRVYSPDDVDSCIVHVESGVGADRSMTSKDLCPNCGRELITFFSWKKKIRVKVKEKED